MLNQRHQTFFYDNVVKSWKKTKPNVNVPNFDSYHYRYDAYHYMPKTCGEDDKRPLEVIEAEERELMERLLPTPTKIKHQESPPRWIESPLSANRYSSELDY
jgi:hypothetical protein